MNELKESLLCNACDTGFLSYTVFSSSNNIVMKSKRTLPAAGFLVNG